MVDNSWCGGIVLGQAEGDWQALDFKTNPVAMYLNDEFVENGVTGDAMGHPFESVAWLAGLLAGQGKQLRAGMVVMTGSTLATGLERVRGIEPPSQAWEAYALPLSYTRMPYHDSEYTPREASRDCSTGGARHRELYCLCFACCGRAGIPICRANPAPVAKSDRVFDVSA